MLLNFLRPKQDLDYCQFPECGKSIAKGGAILVGESLSDKTSICAEHMAKLFRIIVTGD